MITAANSGLPKYGLLKNLGLYIFIQHREVG
jgi:hypothetical protein